MILDIFVLWLIILIIAIEPFVSNRSLMFGVRIHGEKYDEIEFRKIRERYRNLVLAFGIILSLLYWLISTIYESELIFILTAVLLLVFAVVNYKIAYDKTKKVKESYNWKSSENKVVIDTNFRNDKVALNNKWYLIHIGVIVIASYLCFSRYAMIPEEVPVNMNSNGDFTIYMTKDKVLFITLLIQFFTFALMFAIHQAIKNSKQDLSGDLNNLESERKILMTLSKLIYGIFSLVQIFFFISILSYCQIITYEKSIVISQAFFIIFTVGLIISLFVILKRYKNISVGSKSYVDDDKYWKYGIIYFNKNDPTVVIKKRYGIGVTFNFGNKITYVICSFIIVITVALVMFL